jgi:hypothetical protein
MTLTRFQIHERLGGLSGEIKAARELDRENADTLAAKEHEVSLARQAKEKSEANITRLEDEARSLASQYASSVEELIGAPAKDDVELQAIDDLQFTSGANANVFESPLYAHTNGIDKAFDEATHP